MLSRRELFTAGIAGGLSRSGSDAAAPAVEQDPTLQGQREIARAVGQVEDVIRQGLLSPSLSHGVVAKIRVLMEQFLRAHSKFPDYFEIGAGVFIELYDWHVKNRQQLSVTRLADGRYTMQFMFSTMLLRPDQDSLYIGYPYDRV
jgi:hypothetical protein